MALGYALVWVEALAVCVLFMGVIASVGKFISRVWPKRIFRILTGFVFLLMLAFVAFLGNEAYYLGAGPWWTLPYTISLMISIIAGTIILVKKWPDRSQGIQISFLLVASIAFLGTGHVVQQKLIAETNAMADRIIDHAMSQLPEPVAEEDNAYLIYEKQFGVFTEDERKWLSNTSAADFDPTSQEAEDFLAKHQAVMVELHRATSLPGYDFPFEIQSIVDTYKFSEIRGIAYLSGLAAVNHASYGRMDEAMECLGYIRVLSKRIYKYPGTMVWTLIGTAIRAIELDYFERCMYIASVQENREPIEIDRTPPPSIDHCEHLLNMEMAWVASTYKNNPVQLFPYRYLGYGSAAKRASELGFLINPVGFFQANYQLEFAESQLMDLKSIALLPCWNVDQAWDEYDATRPQNAPDLLWSRSAMTPTFTNCKYRANDNAEKIALAVYAHLRLKGDYPNTSEDLIPGFLRAIPTDPLTNKPMKVVFMDGGVSIFSQKAEAESGGPTFKTEFHMGTAYEKHRLQEN